MSLEIEKTIPVNQIPAKRIIVVLGMHRSGTSAITRGLRLFGADLGDNLMAATKGDNEKGFWEDLDIYNINERILKACNSDWKNLTDIPLETLLSDSLKREKTDALEILRKKTDGTSIFAFKDPRTCNLLPFWQDVFSELKLDDSYIISFRDPRSIGDSLYKRDKILPEKTYLLWMKHLRNAFMYTAHKPSAIVEYDKLLDATESQISNISNCLGLPKIDFLSKEYKLYSKEFLASDLRHNKLNNHSSGNYRLPDFIKNALDALESFDKTDPKFVFSLSSNKKWVDACRTFESYSFFYKLLDRFQQNDTLEKKRLIQELESYWNTVENLENKISSIQAEKKNSLQLQEKKQIESLQLLDQELQSFNQSFLGHIFSIIEKTYLIITFRINHKSIYRRLIDHDIELFKSIEAQRNELSETSPKRRIGLAISVVKYFLKHPYSSIRLISPYRIKKLIIMLVQSDIQAARSWVSSRFPTYDHKPSKPIRFTHSTEDVPIKLSFPSFSNIRVSIVIPVYNQYHTTIDCLRSILEHTRDVEYEIIIADDASYDETRFIENNVENIHISRQKRNLGFLKNCNAASKKANGKFILFLNNDTQVQPGWLLPLLNLLETTPKIGMTGPKFIFEDGTLQEAGGIIWQDASGWNFGRNHDANDPEFNYVRDVDYISGACLLIRKSIWNKVGGFNAIYAPAYYEDTDLAFQVRSLGYRVTYQPDSVVMHFEGISNGTDTGSGIKRHQVINQGKFLEKWSDTLSNDHFPNGQSVFSAKERSQANCTVLFIDHYVPFFDKDAGSRSTFLYIKSMLDTGIKVKFLPANFFPHQPYTHELQQLGVEVLYGENYARSWKSWIQDNSKYINVIYLHRPHITEEFIDFLTTLEPKPKLIYFGHDLHFLRTQREAAITNDTNLTKMAEEWKARELNIFKKVDKVYYPSTYEVDLIQSIAPSTDVSAIPLYPISQPKISDYHHNGRNGGIFVGGFNHPPNENAVNWFINEVLPQVIKEVPHFMLHIVGSNIPESLQSQASKSIIIHGYISDDELSQLYNKMRLCVVPLQYGAGVKGKVLEAIQSGIPVITTPIGAEGIPEAETILSICNSSSEFADSIIKLHKSEASCRRYISNYPSVIQRYFSHETIDKVIQRDFLS